MSRALSLLALSIALAACDDEPVQRHERPEESKHDAGSRPQGAQHAKRGEEESSAASDAPGEAGDGAIQHALKPGAVWKSEAPAKNAAVHAVWGVHSPPGVYAITLRKAGSVILFSRGDGVWSEQTNPTGGALESVWASSETDVYAAGPAGIIHSSGDGHWTVQPTPDEWSFFFIAGSGPNDVYAIGKGGLLAHSRGDGVWTKEPGVYHKGQLQSVRAVDKDNAYVVGNGGSILHKSARKWAVEDSGTPSSLYDLLVLANDDVYAVGSHGLILHSTGDGVWTSMFAPPLKDEALFAVWGETANRLYAGGDEGTLLRFDGTTWTTATKFKTSIESIWSDPALGTFLVGRHPKP